MVSVLLVYSFTYPGCLRPGSSGSPGGSDSPGYLSPDHPPGIRHTPLPYNHQPDYIPRQSAQARILCHGTTCSGHRHSTPIDEEAPVPLSARGAYNHCNGPYQTIWCAYFSFIHSLTPGVSGQVVLAALVALIALVIYHLTIHTRDPPHMSYIILMGH